MEKNRLPLARPAAAAGRLGESPEEHNSNQAAGSNTLCGNQSKWPFCQLDGFASCILPC